MKKYFFLILSILTLSCSNTSLEVGMNKDELKEQIGEPDSVIEKDGIPDVYTNKLIKMEVWYYGTDTSFVFANDKLQTIKINTIK